MARLEDWQWSSYHNCSLAPLTAERVLKKDGMVPRTRNTITDPEKLQREFETIRAQGYARDSEEAVEGAGCIGAPGRDQCSPAGWVGRTNLV